MKKIAFILVTMFLLVFAIGCSKQQANQGTQANENVPAGSVVDDVPNVSDIGDNPDTGSIDNISVDTAMQ